MEKFNKFLLNRLFESILEAEPEFISLISNIKDDSFVSKQIYDWIDKKDDIKTNTNYIHKSEKEDDKVLFLPDNQYQRFKSAGQDLSQKNKSEVAIGRFARNLLKDNKVDFSDPDIEQFVTLYKKEWFNSKKDDKEELIKIVTGQDIRKWYLKSNYHEGGHSTLGNSCMRYDNTNEFMEIYSLNPDKISMVIMLDEETKLLVARALIWKLDDGGTYIDRIYYSYEHLYDVIKDWLKKNLNVNNIIFRGDVYNGILECSISNFKVDSYPYMDTFNYLALNIKDNKIDYEQKATFKTSVGDNDRLYFKLLNTNGANSAIYNYIYIEELQSYYKLEDLVRVYPDGNHWPMELSVTSDIYEETFKESDAVWSEYMQDFIYKGDSIEVEGIGIVSTKYYKEITIYIGKEIYPWSIYDDISNNFEKVTKSEYGIYKHGEYNTVILKNNKYILLLNDSNIKIDIDFVFIHKSDITDINILNYCFISNESEYIYIPIEFIDIFKNYFTSNSSYSNITKIKMNKVYKLETFQNKKDLVYKIKSSNLDNSEKLKKLSLLDWLFEKRDKNINLEKKLKSYLANVKELNIFSHYVQSDFKYGDIRIKSAFTDNKSPYLKVISKVDLIEIFKLYCFIYSIVESASRVRDIFSEVVSREKNIDLIEQNNDRKMMALKILRDKDLISDLRNDFYYGNLDTYSNDKYSNALRSLDPIIYKLLRLVLTYVHNYHTIYKIIISKIDI